MNSSPNPLHASHEKHFLPYQIRWIRDTSRLRIMEKSRQIGMTYADAYDSVIKATASGLPVKVWVSSRDELTAAQYIEYAKDWAQRLNCAARDYGDQIIDNNTRLTAHVLRFSNGGAIYCLSSSPDAFEDRTIRIDPDPKLRADLRAIRKTVTSSGHIRFAGEAEDSHCDRFWAKALRQHAVSGYPEATCGAAVA